ncbi:hypothetical protein [Lutibacter sp.]|uniref:hypothetical protein n=1 Tax=Lutibacter sp. TaxID=1925666 RepID=UPI00356A136F
MKKFIYLLPVLALFFTACDPMDEIYADIDAQENIIVGDANYTLTDDDYSILELDGGFESVDDVKSMVPNFLTGKYPVWGKGSSVLVNYNMIGGLTDLAEVSNYVNAVNYTLNIDDYAASGSDVLGFYPAITPSDFLEDVLTDNVEAVEGDVALVKYVQFTEEPIITTTTNYLLADDFDYGSVAGDLSAISDWVGHSGGAPLVGYTTTSLAMVNYPSSDIGGAASIDGFGSQDVNRSFTPKASGTVYLSALVNLSAVGADTGTYFFHLLDQGTNFRARVGAMSDGNGGMWFGIGASSSTLTFGANSFAFDTTYLIVASYNIDNGTSNLYVLTTPEATEPLTPEATNIGTAGTIIERIGIRQGYNGPTGIIDGVRVTNSWADLMVNDIAVDVQGDKTYTDVYYTFNGEYWNPSTNVYYLTSDDYDSMGTASGQPGKYNNFDSGIAPANYLPTFLALAHPFAQEEDALIVMYKYYISGTGTRVRGNLYTVIDGVWTAHSSSLQFGHDGNSWLPDNTIKYTLVNSDYEYMSAQLSGDPEYADLWDSLGYYHDYDYHWTEAQIVHSLGILANNINPTAEEGQKYTFTYLLYDNGLNTVSTNVILTNGVWVLNN